MRMVCSILLFSVAILDPSPVLGQFPTVRLAVVNSPDDTGLLGALLPDFERESGYRVVVYSGEDVFDVARAGQADLVIAHYGHSGTEAFMAQGLGTWPRMVFGNQIALIGPASDPAQIRGLQDAGLAFRKIAFSVRSRFVSNNSAVMKYLESMLWESARRPAKEPWFVDPGVSEEDGMAVAARMNAYYIFALPPFLRWKQECIASAPRDRSNSVPAPCRMDALMLAGPMPHRIMVAIIVNPERVPAINVSGASALQEYLLRPAVQARIESFRDPRSEHQLWRAAGLQNSGAALGFARRP